jgi:hypothetical protein
MSEGVFIYDWRGPCEGAGVVVAFKEGEEHCSCYNVGDLKDPFQWDLSIAQDMYGWDNLEAYKVAEELSRCVPYLLKLLRM